jgi:hypothetical protein
LIRGIIAQLGGNTEKGPEHRPDLPLVEATRATLGMPLF